MRKGFEWGASGKEAATSTMKEISGAAMKGRCAVKGVAAMLLLVPLVAQAQTYSRRDTIVYHDDLSKWVVGQVRYSTNTETGIREFETEYDPVTVLPVKHYGPSDAPGQRKLLQTLTYWPQGVLATVKDGNNNVVTLSNWHRGIPQTIKYPATPEVPSGATQNATVNAVGWITSVTDENGYKTCYAYDSMGRMSEITYTSEIAAGVCDTSFYNKTTQVFEKVLAAEYGIPSGHWRQTVSTGNARKIVYFDAQWRPVVTREYDSANEAATKRFQRFAYDHDGRTTFASYPGTSDALTTGTWTDYDALGRVTSVSQDTELTPSLQTTLTAYLDGFKTRVTTPRGQQTTTSYMAWDKPSTDLPVQIDYPLDTRTVISRNQIGRTNSLVRRNAAGTVSSTRNYGYYWSQELCKTDEPETGATLMGYDAAGNLAWSAAGLAAGTACDSTGNTPAVLARKATRTYDARNRVKTLSFVGGLGNTTYAYTPDGLPSSVVANNGTVGGVAMGTATTNYLYNNRRLLSYETLITPALNWPFDYGYNANGHLAAHNWHGLSINYAPNALGQPTQAGAYATGVSYYPNGAIKQFTYGNGIVHTMTQNARQLPSRSTDCKAAGVCASANRVLDLAYSFDANANVSAITDHTATARQTRGMTYDALDRLTQTTGVSFGTASYTYDQLDNLTRMTVGTSAQVPARDHFYCYNATTKRLDFVRSTSCAGAAVIALDYDPQGNLKNKNSRLHTFDLGNRLRTIDGGIPDIDTRYAYDAHGRRVSDEVGGVAKRSQYIQSGQLVMTGDSRTNKVNEYIYLGGSLVATRERDVPTAVYTVKYHHTDALGSPIAITDPSKVVIQTSEFEPYGKVVNRAETDSPSYTGHAQDASSGLTYMQQRYYDPMIGRFLSVDPVTADAASGGNFNRYWYAGNNPYKFTDPDGRMICNRSKSDCNTDTSSPWSVRPSSNHKSAEDVAAGNSGGESGKATESAPVASSDTSDGSTDDSSIQDMPRVVTVAYQGQYHDQLVGQLAEGMRAAGARVVTELPICLAGGGCARIDIFGRDPLGELFAMEVKTGLRPSFTPGQLAVYPHLSKSGTLASPDPRISQFGYSPGAPLPAIRGVLLYQRDAASPPFVAPIP